jgi:hypothetical protein
MDRGNLDISISPTKSGKIAPVAEISKPCSNDFRFQLISFSTFFFCKIVKSQIDPQLSQLDCLLSNIIFIHPSRENHGLNPQLFQIYLADV